MAAAEMAAAEIQSLIAWYYHASSTEQEGMWAALNGGKTKVRRLLRSVKIDLSCPGFAWKTNKTSPSFTRCNST
jgi:hypothetical protein